MSDLDWLLSVSAHFQSPLAIAAALVAIGMFMMRTAASLPPFRIHVSAAMALMGMGIAGVDLLIVLIAMVAGNPNLGGE